MNIKQYKNSEKVAKSIELNEGDPIYVEVKTKGSNNFYKYFGRFVEVPEFKKNCLSKELRMITQESLNFFQKGNLKLADFIIIRGTKKVWLMSERDIKKEYESGMNPEIYKRWRKNNQ